MAVARVWSLMLQVIPFSEEVWRLLG